MTTVRFDSTAAAAEQGWVPAPAVQATGAPELPPGAPYLLAHHPSRWLVDDETGELLPDLIQVSGQPGVCHTGREVRGGGGDMSGAVLAQQRRGLVVIEGELERRVSGALGAPLYRRIQVRGGHAYLDHGAVHVPGTRTAAPDPTRRVEMLRAVRDVVQPPAPHVLQALIERTERDHAVAARDSDRDPLAARRRDQLADQLDILRAALKPPAPRKRASRKRASDTTDQSTASAKE